MLQAPSGRRPNVVLFISDQQRADTMPRAGTDGQPAFPVRTPHLDWLASRGTLFRRGYCTTPLCAPARVSLLSGLYPHRTGMVSNYTARQGQPNLPLPPDIALLGDYLTPHGYACAYSGKWHLGTGSDRRGFTAFAARSGVHDVDLVPTILRACGLGLPDGLHGVDIGPLVEGDDTPVRDGLALEYHSHIWGHPPTPLRAWVTPDWKHVGDPWPRVPLGAVAPH